jgi:hypothetical protein
VISRGRPNDRRGPYRTTDDEGNVAGTFDARLRQTFQKIEKTLAVWRKIVNW